MISNDYWLTTNGVYKGVIFMAVENIVCPHCGKEALATIPSGQHLIRI